MQWQAVDDDDVDDDDDDGIDGKDAMMTMTKRQAGNGEAGGCRRGELYRNAVDAGHKGRPVTER